MRMASTTLHHGLPEALEAKGADAAQDGFADRPSRITASLSSPRRDGRVLIFVESFFGFGHFNIVDLLAKELLDQGLDVGVASSTFDHNGTSFNFGGTHKFYLPPLSVNAGGKRCKPNQEPFQDDKDAYTDLIYQGTRQVMQKYDPQLVVYELYPFMMPWRDASAQAVNDYYRDAGRLAPERIALCRDIIHASKPEGVLQRLKNFCTRLMVRGDRRFASLEESQAEWKSIPLPIDYVGNFAAKAPVATETQTQDEVVVFGGGAYRTETDALFMEAIAGASRLSEAFKEKPFKMIIGEGTPDNVVDTMLSSADANFSIMRPVNTDTFKKMLASATAVVTRAGYNTCFELVRMQKPFVVIPRRFKEQRLRAAMLERSGYGIAVPEEELSAEAIARALDRCLQPTDRQAIDFQFDGAKRMARSLATLL